ncbi:MAG: MFS transporter [Verrucomicrobia bacterium]|nr:MFS transporter [Verrucomicrobiota bacterium]MDA1069497.1 MFS transporter [Verrucomicrobiota bacterium]
MSSAIPEAKPLTPTQWMICFIAVIGFAFDIYELLMLPLIVRPALMELIGAAPGSPEFGMWVGRLFYIPAFFGGVFGLLGGWLTDRLGRRRVLTYSILLYAIGAFAAGFSTSVWMLLFFRILVFVGVCVEFVAAVAWLAELFPNPKQREKVLGYTQAFSSIGGFMVAMANGLAVTYALHLPALHLPDFLNFFGGTIGEANAPWRYTLISGLIPAIPLLIIRPFLPESPVWQKKKDAGTLKRPHIKELFATKNMRRTTIVTTIMFALAYGAAFGAIQHMPRIAPGLAEVQAQSQEAGEQATAKALSEGKPADVAQKAGGVAMRLKEQNIIASLTKFQEIGGLVGRVVLVLLLLKIVSRQRVIRMFIAPGLIVMPLVFAMALTSNLSLSYVGMFVIALLTVGQFSFWGNYLPRVYPVHLRGTGESFAANIGGRMIGTSFAWVTSTLATVAWMPGGTPTSKLAYTAAIIGFLVFLGGFIASWYLPEPPKEDLPE